jgi:hypothetical protein
MGFEVEMKNFAFTFFILVFYSQIVLSATFTFSNKNPLFYPCNVGIRHAESSAICTDVVTGNACVPSVDNVSSCVCTSSGTAGSWDRDIAHITYGDWVNPLTPKSPLYSSDLVAINSQTSYNTLFASEDIEYTKQMTNLSIDLGSEMYGSEYFVDICYLGPTGTVGTYGSNYSMKSTLTVTNLKLNYQTNANLQARAEIKCFLNKSNQTTTGVIPGVTATNYAISSGAKYTSMTTSANTITILQDSGLLNVQGDKVPRFCLARYYFKEFALSRRLEKQGQANTAIYIEIKDKAGL